MALTDQPDEGPPLSPVASDSSGKGHNGDPALVEIDLNHHEVGRRPSSTALNSPFHLQGALELGQPMEHWDYSGTQDDLNAVDSQDSIAYLPGQGFRRYYPALRTVIPIRFEPKERKVLPVDSAGFFSFATFAWMTSPMYKLFRKGTFGFESYRCSIMESCTLNSQRLEYLWEEELKRRGPAGASLFRVSWRFMRTRVIFAAIVYTLAILLGFLTPLIFLPILVNNARKPENYYVEGILVAVGILVVDLMRAVLVSFHGAIYIRTGLRLRSALLTMVYRKVVSMNTLGQTSAGQILNLFSNDSARLLDYGQFLHMWVSGLISVLVAFTWIIWALQAAGAAGVASFLVFFLLQYVCTVLTARFRARAVKATDNRVQKTKEALAAVKIIKVNAWEDVFHKIIAGVRGEELNLLQKIVFLTLLTSAMSQCLPSAAALVSFMTCFALGYDLSPAQGFAALAVFMWSRHGIVFLPVSLGAIAQVKPTMLRVKELLLQPDTRPCVSMPKDPGHSVSLTRATFAWDRPIESVGTEDPKPGVLNNGKMNNGQQDNMETDALSPLTSTENAKFVEVLHDITVSISKGQLVGICGPMSSGKSSLISAVLGQLHLLRGDLAIRGNAAYVPQQPWLIKATVRENIVLGDALDPKRYYNAIRCCALNDDLHTLPAGDQTEVAEAGITLSGGQKQRVALARAVYSDRDIVLLDDPLASLDNIIAEYVFTQCIKDVLKDKTVLFACSQVKFLQSCDYIIFLRHGQIVEHGTPTELTEAGGFYRNFIQEYGASGNPDFTIQLPEKSGLIQRRPSPTGFVSKGPAVPPIRTDDSATPSVASLAEAGRLVLPEEKGQGSITWNTYFEYMRAMGGCFVALGICLSVIIFMAVTVLCSWYLAMILVKEDEGMLFSSRPYINQTDISNDTDIINATTQTQANASESLLTAISMEEGASSETTKYIMVFGLLLLTMFISGIFQAFIFSKATILASKRLHDRILKKVFHGTMRFFETTPIGRILNIFSKDLDEVDFMLATFLNVTITLLSVTALSFIMVAAVFPWFLLAMPILGCMFLYVLLVFRSTSREVKRRENVSRSPLFSHINATLSGLATLHAYEKEKLFENEFIRLQDDNSTLNHLLVGSIKWMGFRLDMIVTIATTLVAALVVVLHGSIDPAFAALALVYCSTMGGLFNYTVRVTSESQARFTNVERILRYEQSLEEEGPDRKAIPPASLEWPAKGQITFENVDLRYRENIPLALSDVSFNIQPNQKVAIVGRTGAGKSSIGVALFRLVNTCRGQILVDNVDIAQLALHDVRSRMSIIPQDPVLFKGTIRFNLDPQNAYHDEEIWQALAKIRLQEKITSLDRQLSYVVAESGDNFSVGEKQLLCLARATLRHSTILFMDEATASMDDDTNSLIHQVLMDSFTDCTILTIAHRLQHVQDYDLVLVLRDGKVVEFDDPKILASNPSSLFAKMSQSNFS